METSRSSVELHPHGTENSINAVYVIGKIKMAPEVSVHSASVNFKTIITENVLMRVETPVFCHGTRPRFLDEKSK